MLKVIADSSTDLQPGDKALQGKDYEYLKYHRFEAIDHDRWITGRGPLIQIYEKEAAKAEGPQAFWEHDKKDVEGHSLVPKYHMVRVIDGSVKMTNPPVG